MAVVLRLQKTGKKKAPYYRVVAIHKSRGPKGRPIEVIGHYNPRGEKLADKVTLKLSRVEHWLKEGAKATETVGSLVKRVRKAAKTAAK